MADPQYLDFEGLTHFKEQLDLTYEKKTDNDFYDLTSVQYTEPAMFSWSEFIQGLYFKATIPDNIVIMDKMDSQEYPNLFDSIATILGLDIQVKDTLYQDPFYIIYKKNNYDETCIYYHKKNQSQFIKISFDTSGHGYYNYIMDPRKNFPGFPEVRMGHHMGSGVQVYIPLIKDNLIILNRLFERGYTILIVLLHKNGEKEWVSDQIRCFCPEGEIHSDATYNMNYWDYTGPIGNRTRQLPISEDPILDIGIEDYFYKFTSYNQIVNNPNITDKTLPIGDILINTHGRTCFHKLPDGIEITNPDQLDIYECYSKNYMDFKIRVVIKNNTTKMTQDLPGIIRLRITNDLLDQGAKRRYTMDRALEVAIL